MKYLKQLSILLGLSLALFSCSEDDEGDPTPTTPSDPTIAEIATNDSRTDSLVVALQETNLVSTFQNAGTYTVFAPDNAAFATLINGNPSWFKISDIDTTMLKNILMYHVLGTEVRAGDLTDDTYATTLNTEGPGGAATQIEVDVVGVPTLNGNSNITATDIEASNGVVHVISAVLMPQDIVDFAINDERFDSLEVALTQPGFNYASTLQGTGPFTVFAPTNAAFVDLLSTLSLNSISEIDTATLSGVLEYHVAAGANVVSTTLTDGQTINTLGGTLEVSLASSPQLITTDSTQSNVDIIVTDVQATNGIIHAVDAVLMP